MPCEKHVAPDCTFENFRANEFNHLQNWRLQYLEYTLLLSSESDVTVRSMTSRKNGVQAFVDNLAYSVGRRSSLDVRADEQVRRKWSTDLIV